MQGELEKGCIKNKALCKLRQRATPRKLNGSKLSQERGK